MDFRCAPDSRAAIEKDLTVRCLTSVDYDGASRHSRDAISAAGTCVEHFTAAMLKAIGKDGTEFETQLNVVRLASLRKPELFILWEVFLAGCNVDLRSEVTSSTTRPVHEMRNRGDGIIMFRAKQLDQPVAAIYAGMGEFDKGPKPLFADEEHPPFYVDDRQVEDDTAAATTQGLIDAKG
nr:hypothetical protein B0A51_13989 [Rachicladosporium sp. CCFEE 5018]